MAKRRRRPAQPRTTKVVMQQKQEVTAEIPEELEAQFQVRLRNHGTAIMNRMLFCFMLFELALLAQKGGLTW